MNTIVKMFSNTQYSKLSFYCFISGVVVFIICNISSHYYIIYAVTLFLLVTSLILFIKKKYRLTLYIGLIIVFTVIISILMINKQLEYKQFVNEYNQYGRLLCSVERYPVNLSNGYYKGTVKVYAASQRGERYFTRLTKGFKLVIRTREPLIVGNNIDVTGIIELPSEDISGFNYRRYLFGKGVYGVINNARLQSFSENKTPMRVFYKLRELFYEKIKLIDNGRCSGFIASILIGDRSLLEADDLAGFRDTGLAHILAISGLHFSVISSFLLAILSKILPRRIAGIVLTPLMVVYYIILNPAASCLRSLITIIQVGVTQSLSIRLSGLNSLFITGSVMLLINPYYLIDAGFLFSFCAVFSIIAYNSFLENLISFAGKQQVRSKLNFLGKIYQKLKSSLVCSISASSGITFIQISIFGGFQPLAIPLSVIFVPVFEVYFIINLILIIIFCVSPVIIAGFISGFIVMINTIFLDSVNCLSIFGTINTGQMPLFLAILIIVLLDLIVNHLIRSVYKI